MTVLPFPKRDRRDEVTRLSQDAVRDMWHRIEKAMDSLKEADEPGEDTGNRTYLAIRCLDLLGLVVAHAIAKGIDEKNADHDDMLDVFDSLIEILQDEQSRRRQESAA